MSFDVEDSHTFRRWVERYQVSGIDGLGNKAMYVPPQLLLEYWLRPEGTDRIHRIWNAQSHTPMRYPVKELVKRWSRTFSTLLYISSAHCPEVYFIKDFVHLVIDDHNMPFENSPEPFSHSHDGRRAWEDFRQAQYLFCPISFGPDRMLEANLQEKCVLPLTPVEILSGVPGATDVVQRCILQDSSNLKTPNNEIVIKEFEPDKDYDPHTNMAPTAFVTEVNFYANLENIRVEDTVLHKHFLTYYGSFLKQGRGFVLLEYADQGSLQDFFKRNNLPYDRQELCELWKSLFTLFSGLAMIHNLNDHVNRGAIVQAIHQDFKPANVFVFREGKGTSYSYRFKIGDFGMSSTELVKARRLSSSAIDKQGTKMYAAPEFTQHYPEMVNLSINATSHMDVWSIGCVLCEALVWTICGYRGLDEFHRLRQEETNEVCSRHGSEGYSGCFHDGHRRIKAVDQMIQRAVNNRRVFDDITERIGRFLCEEILLVKPDDRLSAYIAQSRLEAIVDGQRRQGRPTRSNTFATVRSDDNSSLSGFPGQQRGEPAGASTHPRPHTISSYPHAAGTPIAYLSPRNSYMSTYENMVSDQFGTIQLDSNSGTGNDPFNLAQPPRSLISSAPVGDLTPVSAHRPSKPFKNQHGSDGPAWPSGDLSGSSSRLQGSSQDVKASHSPSNGPHPVMYPSGLIQTSQESFGHEAVDISGEQQHIQRASTVKSHAPGSKQPLPLAKSAVRLEKVTIQQVLDWKKESSESRLSSLLPDYTWSMNLIKDRDQIFIIDDSASMRSQHWKDVCDTFEALSCLATEADPNGIELFLASNPTNKEKPSMFNPQKHLVQFLKKQSTNAPVGSCNMESSLSTVFDDIKDGLKGTSNNSSSWRKRAAFFSKTTRPRGVNVYILTNGVWEGGDKIKCGVERPITTLIQQMQSFGKDRTYVALQFIQFGNDDLGKARLDYLDNELGKELNFDIVDRRHFERDGVWHMMIGSISPGIDDENDLTGAG